MGNDVVLHEGGGSLAHYEPTPTVGVESTPAPAPATSAGQLTDEQHFAAFERDLTSRLMSGIGLDERMAPRVAQRIVKVADSVVNGNNHFENAFSSLGLFAQRLIERDERPNTIRTALEAGAVYLWNWIGLQAQSEAYDPEKDADDADTTRTALKSLWGTSYSVNRQRIVDFLNNVAPPAVADMVFDGRDVEGRRHANSPHILAWILQMTNQPDTQPVPPSGPLAPNESEELRNIEKMIGNQYSGYWKGSDAPRLQARYTELLAKKGKR